MERAALSEEAEECLRRVIFPGRVAWIEAYAFAHCEQLERVEFAGTIRAIGDAAFRHNPSLKHVALPFDTTVDDSFDENVCVRRMGRSTPYAIHAPNAHALDQIATDAAFCSHTEVRQPSRRTAKFGQKGGLP
ncbi:hypothetical protein AB1Y20_022920 [Prymnesium parvum]|uniref:Leucine-rich repeat domain-containing protein n=1 Tax=Prymnesium parvum TaxID=97485 RepID=A0AB34JCJ0_PRYPA